MITKSSIIILDNHLKRAAKKQTKPPQKNRKKQHKKNPQKQHKTNPLPPNHTIL